MNNKMRNVKHVIIASHDKGAIVICFNTAHTKSMVTV